MDIKELRKMTIIKLRDLAKQVTDLQGVGGMEKEELIQAIAKAEGISYEAPPKDITTISSIKQEIRTLKKQKEELLASSRDDIKLGRIGRKIKRLKRLTRRLAHQAGPKQAPQPAAAPAQGAPAASG
ncbi:MAG: hypothetical protein ACREQA_17645 [Candidatus Binatia bacterium]